MHAELARLAQDVVVDVGDVAHAPRLVAGVAQPALQHVVGEVHRGVAEVRRVVGRDAARVHRDDGPDLELDDRAAPRVVEAHAQMPPEPQRRVDLVADVDRDARRRERLDRAGLGEAADLDGPQALRSSR